MRNLFILSLIIAIVACKNEPQNLDVNTTSPRDMKPSAQVTDKVESEVADKTSHSEDTISREELSNVSDSSSIQAIPVEDEENDNTDEIIEPKNLKTSNVRSVFLDHIVFDTLIYSFDTISEGEVVKFKFKFTNKNKSPIEVKSVDPDCGCTVPSYPFLPIEPNESGYIGVTYHSVSKQGEQHPRIKVKFKNIEEEAILKLSGYVSQRKDD